MNSQERDSAARARLTLFGVRIDPRPTTLVLTAVVLALAAVNLALRVVRFFGGIDDDAFVYLLFDLTEERNIPTAATVLLLLAAAGLALWSAVLARRRRHPSTPYWVLFGLVLAYVAIDEAVEIHERALDGFARIWIDGALTRSFAWVFPGALLVLLVVAVLWRFVMALPRSYRWAFIGAAALYLGGAIGVEVLGDVVHHYTESRVAVGIITITAETLEMLGATLLIYGLLLHLAEWQPATTGAVSSPAADS